MYSFRLLEALYQKFQTSSSRQTDLPPWGVGVFRSNTIDVSMANRYSDHVPLQLSCRRIPFDSTIDCSAASILRPLAAKRACAAGRVPEKFNGFCQFQTSGCADVSSATSRCSASCSVCGANKGARAVHWACKWAKKASSW